MVSTGNVLIICGKSDSSSVRRTAHVCGLSTDVSDSGIAIYVSGTL
jgi:hypothetical protein